MSALLCKTSATIEEQYNDLPGIWRQRERGRLSFLGRKPSRSASHSHLFFEMAEGALDLFRMGMIAESIISAKKRLSSGLLWTTPRNAAIETETRQAVSISASAGNSPRWTARCMRVRFAIAKKVSQKGVSQQNLTKRLEGKEIE